MMASSKPREAYPPAELAALEQSVAGRGPLPRAFLLLGEERFFRERAIGHLSRAAEARGLELAKHDAQDPDFDVAGLCADLAQPPMFAAGRFILLRNASPALKKEGDQDSAVTSAFAAFVRDTRTSGVCAIDAESLRADHPLYKTVVAAGGVVLKSRRLYDSAPPWDPDPRKAELVQWCVTTARSRGLVLDPASALDLVARTGNDLFALESALERLKEGGARTVRSVAPGASAASHFAVAEHLCHGRLAPALSGLAALYEVGFVERDGSKESDHGAVNAVLLMALRSKVRQALIGAACIASGLDVAAAAERARVPSHPRARAEFEARLRVRSSRAWQRMYTEVQDLERTSKSGATLDANDMFAFALRWQVAPDERTGRRAPAPRPVRGGG